MSEVELTVRRRAVHEVNKINVSHCGAGTGAPTSGRVGLARVHVMPLQQTKQITSSEHLSRSWHRLVALVVTTTALLDRAITRSGRFTMPDEDDHDSSISAV